MQPTTADDPREIWISVFGVLMFSTLLRIPELGCRLSRVYSRALTVELSMWV